MKFDRCGSWSAAVRLVLAGLATALALAACGGGGDGNSQAVAPSLTGAWQLSLTQSGTTTAGGTVPAANVLTEQQVAAIDTTSFAQVLASSTYQGYTVSVSASTITITGPATNLSILVNSLSTGNYRGCGLSCGVGASISFDMTVNITVSGTLNGTPQSGSGSGTVTVKYTRTS